MSSRKASLGCCIGGALALACAQLAAEELSPWVGAPGLPSLVTSMQDPATDWVPVVLMTPPQSLLPGNDGVLLGFLQIHAAPEQWSAPTQQRVQLQGKLPLMDRLSLKGMLAASEFKPCLGLIEPQNELSPLRRDLCDRWSGDASGSQSLAVGAQLDMHNSWIGVSLQYSEGQDLSLAGPAFASTPLPQAFTIQPSGQLGFGDGVQTGHHQSSGLGMQAMLELDPQSRIGISLALARAQLQSNPGMAPTVLDQGSLSFTLEQGNLGAIIGTRVVDLPGLEDFLPWAGLDLGVSWRLPWQGVISVGAQNLISRGSAPEPGLDPVLDDGAEAFQRIPYVRYHQDL